MKPSKQKWLDRPAESDFAAAGRFLSLLVGTQRSQTLADAFTHAQVVSHKANDLLRASRLPLLPVDDPEVRKDLKRVQKGEKLSPVLLVYGDLDSSRALTVADGYHRICASYHLDEDDDIPCVIAENSIRERPDKSTVMASTT